MKKYSIKLQNHSTSISLENEFIEELKSISKHENKSVAQIISQIDKSRLNSENSNNLSSQIRIFILKYIKSKK